MAELEHESRAGEVPILLDPTEPAFAATLLDAAPVVLLVLDAEGRLIHQNALAERLSGRSLAELRGRDWFEACVAREDRERMRGLLIGCEDGAGIHSRICELRGSDGHARPVEWTERRLCASASEPGCVIVVGVDISQRMLEASEREELRRRFEVFAGQIDQVFFVTNAARDHVCYLSPAFERVVGLSREEVYADAAHLSAVLHPEDRSSFLGVFGKPLTPGEQVDREYRILRPHPGGGEPELRWVWVRYGVLESPCRDHGRIAGIFIDITERKRAAEQLEELGRRFALFDGAIDEVFLLLNPRRDRVLYVSESLERVYGVARDEVFEDAGALLDYVHPIDRERVQRTVLGAMPDGGRVLTCEFRTQAPGGSKHWLITRMRVLGQDSSLPGAVVAIVVDITARRVAEDQLRRLTEYLELRVEERTRSLERERRRLHRVLDGMAVYVGILDSEGRLRQVNRFTREKMGKLWPTALGHALDEIPGVEYVGGSHELIRSALVRARAGRPARFDLESRTRHEHLVITDLTLSPILDEDGRVNEIVFSGVDVTEGRLNEQRLRDSLAALAVEEARLADAQRLAEVGDWDWDIPADRLVWSEQLYRIFGLDTDVFEPSNGDYLTLLHEDERARVRAAVDHAVTSGERYEDEHRIVRSDGELRYLQVQGEVTLDAEGRALRMRGTAHDITRQKQVEAQLRSSLAEKEVLLHEIHHRVKNNLQIVASLLYLQGVSGDDEVRAVLDECRTRIRSMALIHEQLYLSGELSRIDMGEFLTKLSAELTRVFADAGTPVIRVSGELVLDIERAVPLALLVNELLTNALKYAYPGPRTGSTPEVRVRLEARALVVEDDGVGLPEGVESLGRSSLGLRLVCSLAEQLDARLSFEREGGTRVRLVLPEADTDSAVLP